MKRILTGIQSTGTPHLGNILGVMIPSIDLSNQNSKFSSFIFVADLHSLTKIKDFDVIRNNTYQIAAAWLAFGLNTEKSIFYRQSDVSEVTELAWYLNCFFPFQRLTLAHSFKKKRENHEKINVGLFTYPILMAADILLYNAEIIPVGKDQLQHVEIARYIANRFNQRIGKKIFVSPESFIQQEAMSIIGTDGEKMSKSKKNCIDIFSSDEILRKQIMNIHTDNKSLKEKKNPDKDSIMSLYKLLAPIDRVEEMRKKYIEGGYGYLDAKIALYECIIKKFSVERKNFFSLIKKKSLLDRILSSGAQKAKYIAKDRLNKIRKNLKLNPSS
ncbi:MAG: tryptophan--tRNA ligase [Flavobacteriales bacterium]|jgi:tryptophanyl-tRNA synthetase|uniref:tryptophan--tRNA ligase n=1 Tax=Blattabacterium sp. (Mastotermes darwiniensis) TaxID=39768 RepID=UPI000231DE16|nr:tryptophan--tRNA ligase [Blattabacterium sp. (Mastotermes darwiniensis)]AER40586.1 tryptophan--tRNA ligase [Blattabacterium sp. (Mastotermes darwiniensis) str. MADAR]MDR1805083.1 tryptophan--tRNA ligase [Flavobacteriales bacterium]